jgi:ABC-type transport system involved in cytochrome c biogenesis permease subunit
MDWIYLEHVTVYIAFGAMLTAMMAYILHVANHEHEWFGRLGTLCMWIALGTDATAMTARYFTSGHVPWSNLYEAIMYCTLIMIIIYLVVERYYEKKLLGIGAATIGIMMFGYANIILPKEFRGSAPLMPALQSYWIKIHTTIIVGSYAPFMLAAATAVAYLVVTRGQDLPASAMADLGVST